MSKKITKRRGFSLLEVIIALALITITFVAVTSLVSQNLQTNVLNRNFITAHYLNAEAIEVVRNMRDSNWLQNFSFNAQTPEWLWGPSLWPQSGTRQVVKVEHRTGGDSPWQLIPTIAGFEGNELYLVTDPLAGRSYAHESNGQKSSFARYIELEIVNDPDLTRHQELPPLKVTAVTMFKVGKRDQELRYSTLFTDWKQGPL